MDKPVIAAAAPLYFGLATPGQGRAVAGRLQRGSVTPDGFVALGLAAQEQAPVAAPARIVR
jgi:alpha,alpha-trehalase